MDEARRRRRLRLLLAPIFVLIVMSNLGTVLLPSQLEDNPLLLLVLDARIRTVVLVAAGLDAIPYYVVGTLRLLVADPLFYLLGFWYGDAALSWVERKSGSMGRFLRDMEGFFGVAAYPLVFVAPNNYICLFAGAARMHPAVFLTLNLGGTVTRLALIRYVGDIFAGPRDALLGFIGEYQIPLTIFAVVVVVGQALWDKRKGTGELEELRELEEELDDVDPRPPSAPGIDVAERVEQHQPDDEAD